MSMSMSVSVSVMGGWVGGWTMSRGEQDGNVFLAGIGGFLEGGPKWGCGDVDVDDEEEGCWRLKLSCENFVDVSGVADFFRLVGQGIFFVVEESSLHFL